MELVKHNKGCLYAFSKGSFGIKEADFSLRIKPNIKNDLILVLVADDHPYLIHGVENDLNKNPKIKIVGTASSYDEMKKSILDLQPDIVLMDLRMPGQDKYDFKNYISDIKAQSNSKILVFSNETGWARIHRCLEAGASAYIEKAISIGRLAEFIHRVYENDELIIFTAEELPRIQFSKRQSEILHYIADGKENDEIASLLNIDIKTVQSYVNEIKSKLSDAFGIHQIRPRTLLLLASELGFGKKL